MSTENIKPEKITKPIQLLAAWLLGLILINASFLTAASQISKPDWAAGMLLIAAVANVPTFLFSLFLLQTKFRPEMQEDTYYSKYLERKYNEAINNKTNQKTIEEEQKATEEVVEKISKELGANSQIDKKKKIETIIRDRDKQRLEKRIGESRGLSQLYMYADKWPQFVDAWQKNYDFKRDIDELLFYQVVDGSTEDLKSLKLSKLGLDLAKSLFDKEMLWNQKHKRAID
jgi:hypothetical protein